jgi:sarcosine oxidase subunit delta
MLLIHCPYCEEERPELEFRNAGEAHVVRSSNMAAESDEDFEKFFFIRDNPKGIIYERWRHIHGCARLFNAVRDTVSDKFIMTYKAGEPKPKKLPVASVAAAAPAAPAAYANRPPDQLNEKPAVRKAAPKNEPAQKKEPSAKRASPKKPGVTKTAASKATASRTTATRTGAGKTAAKKASK